MNGSSSRREAVSLKITKSSGRITHREVLHNAMGYAAANGFVVRGLDFSPVKGPEGNIEYLMFVQKSEQPGVLDDSVAEQVVAASHSSLDK